jgi:hypothetical protein
MSTDDITKVSQELAVHQIVLEMQTEELRRAQVELEKSRDTNVVGKSLGILLPLK